ncbi:sensor histidine kinase [Streptomyces sp. SM12]|uniref:sensor histidine kinase n=1 Tax=Streptomyces sp. SM12 TaxID=1071602 RepID=UPI0021560C40|nr:histidine kinase [Streptomyces sp. SM12]
MQQALSALKRYRRTSSRIHLRHYTYFGVYMICATEAWVLGVWVFAIRDMAEPPVRLLLVAVGCVHLWLLFTTTFHTLRSYLGEGKWPDRRFALFLAVTLVGVALGLVLIATGRTGENAVVVLTWFPIFFSGPAMMLSSLWRGMAVTAVPLVVAWLSIAALDPPGVSMAQWVLFSVSGCVFVGSMFRTSSWVLKIVEELHQARETQARLAVAEERLRFGRDMHDVLGRNLSVIALKSELAVQLSQRGSAAATEQMAEVQQIARESQQEMRAVLRGYREADLTAEIAGARGVLEAAGIRCTVTPGPTAKLPEEVATALGWVVREGATNVLRHSEAARCSLRVELREEAVTVGTGGTGPADSADAAGPEDAAEAAGTAEAAPSEGTTPAEEAAAGSGGLRLASLRQLGTRIGAVGRPAGASRAGVGATGGPVAVLTMENNGVAGSARDARRRAGSGLAGLRERLGAVGGTLTAEPGSDGTFLLTARVPCPPAGERERSDEGTQ